jgi:hypothetical protein
MWLISKRKKRENARRAERRLAEFVDRKERKEERIDDYGREIILRLRDYESNPQGNIRYKSVMNEAKRYLKNNYNKL